MFLHKYKRIDYCELQKIVFYFFYTLQGVG